MPKNPGSRFTAIALLLGLLLPAFPAAAADDLLKPIGALGEYLDDAGITAEVKARLLAEKGLDASAIRVTTDNAVVRLEGTVETPEQAALAEQAAKGLSNVKGVENRLRTRL